MRNAQTVTDHIRALEASRHDVFVCDMNKIIPWFIHLQDFDAVVIHYSLVMCMDHYLSPKSRKKIKDFKGLKACFIQDEYRFVNQTIEAMKYLGIHIVFTCVPPSEFSKVYAKYIKEIICVNVLTGYVPEALLHFDVPPYSERMVDVCYRGRKIPYWLGELAQEKTRIAERFQEDAKKFNLVTDIDFSEQKRLYGKKWIEFLSNAKACLGVESGASVFDFEGTIERNVGDYIIKHPNASFEEVQKLFFKDLEGKIKLNQISPRCFESAALKTLMILYEGEYSGILFPEKHYVPLKKDHSNMREVVRVIQDSKRATEIISCAYEEIALNPQLSYNALTNLFDETMEREFKQLFLKKGLFREPEKRQPSTQPPVQSPRLDGSSLTNAILKIPSFKSAFRKRLLERAARMIKYTIKGSWRAANIINSLLKAPWRGLFLLRKKYISREVRPLRFLDFIKRKRP